MKRSGIDGCKRPQNGFLHQPENVKSLLETSTKIVDTHSSVGLPSFEILQVYEVETSNKAKKMKFNALVNSGSRLSWIGNSSVDQLNLHGAKQVLTVNGIYGTETHDSEFGKITIRFEENGSEKIQMAVHKNRVIGDKFHNIQRVQSQYAQLQRVNRKSFIVLKMLKLSWEQIASL